jgi:hypothetical protein
MNPIAAPSQIRPPICLIAGRLAPNGPVVASLVAVTHQAGGDRVAVSLVADQDATEGVGALPVQGLEKGAEVELIRRQDRSSFCSAS